MGLYHRHPKVPLCNSLLSGGQKPDGLAHRIISACLLLAWLLASCTPPQATQALITVSILSDGQTTERQLPAGSTVQQALDQAGLSLGPLDRVEPPLYTVLGAGSNIRVVRVTEEFEIKEEVIPFEYQTLRNESLPKDKEILIQRGQNGLKEITYRRVFEDGVDISGKPVPVKSLIVEEPLPEIRMIGIQSPFSPQGIAGRIYYLRDGNLWTMEGTTANRRALITTGDLDGRILSLSSDGGWLLFTRLSTLEGQINELWVANLGGGRSESGGLDADAFINLNVPNVIHFADWVPDSNTKIIFSTVEPRSAAPGWQANNDLNVLTFSTTGWTTSWNIIVESNSGGVYGWWGTHFEWGPDVNLLTFAQPGGLGLVNYKNGVITNTLELTPLQTRGDWAWVPGFTWGPDGKVLYTVSHPAPAGASAPEESSLFDLVALPLGSSPALPLVSQTGMFAYPLASPLMTFDTGEIDYQIAYLQAIFPDQSETSRYRLAVMDRDGSNRRTLFPQEEGSGLEPQLYWGAWSPAIMPESGNYALAVLYQGNLWLVDVITGEAVQVTSDGLTSRVLWKNFVNTTSGN
ncbi:MAG: G5 domain-containing protein [Anaerolineales bacterium]|nr:G5 domain-containing protein [Anaerolineales bacterium]